MFITLNRYKEFRDEKGEYTLFYWHLLAVRLAFVILFEVRLDSAMTRLGLKKLILTVRVRFICINNQSCLNWAFWIKVKKIQKRDFNKWFIFCWFSCKVLRICLGMFLSFQHVVFGICKLIDFLVPDVPEALELKIKRERYLAKQALADTDTIMKVCIL